MSCLQIQYKDHTCSTKPLFPLWHVKATVWHVICSSLSTYTASTDELWIGLNDRRTEGLFDWSDHSTVSFTSWEYGKPTVSSDTEDCVLMREEVRTIIYKIMYNIVVKSLMESIKIWTNTKEKKQWVLQDERTTTKWHAHRILRYLGSRKGKKTLSSFWNMYIFDFQWSVLKHHRNENKD